MRWFWLFILGLCILTGALYAQRRGAERAEQARLQAEAESQRAATPARRPRRDRDRGAQQAAASEPAQPAATTPASPDTQPGTDLAQAEPTGDDSTETPGRVSLEPDPVEVEVQADPEPGQQEQAAEGFNPGGLISTMNELRDQLPSERRSKSPSSEMKPATSQATRQAAADSDASTAPNTDSSPEQNPEPVSEIVIDLPGEDQAQGNAPDEQEPAPSYEQRADGSFRVIDANIWVQGAGTASEPYVLGWDVLKSIEKTYDPKNGKETLPGWLDLLDGKVVTIEGNSLVPVVASTTRELLVMQNPWDGCCIGVPPTPYDAVEVSLSHDVDFGNSAVGYGTVQGTFYVDPYVVDGWVLGVYIIEDAKYRSGEGVTFPEF